MDEIDEQDFGVECSSIIDYREAWACRFLAMASKKEIEEVAIALADKIELFFECQMATKH